MITPPPLIAIINHQLFHHLFVRHAACSERIIRGEAWTIIIEIYVIQDALSETLQVAPLLVVSLLVVSLLVVPLLVVPLLVVPLLFDW